jgi:hypothetical protein
VRMVDDHADIVKGAGARRPGGPEASVPDAPVPTAGSR